MTKPRLRVSLACAMVLALTVPSVANADNWFELQGISNPAWGMGKWTFFLQPQFQRTMGSDVRVGRGFYAIRPNLIGPHFSNDRRVTMFRARAMLRGSFSANISYFIAGEFGDGGYNYSNGNYTPHIIDAHVTFSNYVPGVRFEVGNLRAPGPETAMQGYVGYTFFDLFPTITNQLMNVHFYDRDAHYGSNPSNGGLSIPDANMSSANGFRYPGVMAFDWFKPARNIELAYGAMVASYGKLFEGGSYNGTIAAGRIQASYLLGGGKGAFRNDVTAFAWYQHANPTVNGASTLVKRDGVGLTFRDGYMRAGGVHVKAEYIQGWGNIAAPSPFVEAPGLKPIQYETTLFAGSSNKATGYYISGGVFVSPRIEVNLRYDYYDRLPNLPAQERVFRNAGVGATYYFSPATKIMVDYFRRRLGIPHPDAIGPVGNPQRETATSIANSFGNELDVFAVLAF